MASRLLQLEQYYAASPHISFSFALPRSAPLLPRGNIKTKRPERQGHVDRMKKRQHVIADRIDVNDWITQHPWNPPVWKPEKPEKPIEEKSGKVEETKEKIDIFPENQKVETVETQEKESVNESNETTHIEPKVEPRVEPKMEPKVERKVERKVEPKGEPSRVSLKQKLRKNLLFRFHCCVCWILTPPSACKYPPNRDIRW